MTFHNRQNSPSKSWFIPMQENAPVSQQKIQFHIGIFPRNELFQKGGWNCDEFISAPLLSNCSSSFSSISSSSSSSLPLLSLCSSCGFSPILFLPPLFLLFFVPSSYCSSSSSFFPVFSHPSHFHTKCFQMRFSGFYSGRRSEGSYDVSLNLHAWLASRLRRSQFPPQL